MTFSLIARCSETGQFGAVISSSSISVGSRCPWARSKVGAVSTQNVTLPSIGPMVLDALGQSRNAPESLESVMAQDQFSDYRQVIVVDNMGKTASHNGERTLGIPAIVDSAHCIAAGNLLANISVPQKMVDAFLSLPHLDLANRLLQALDAGNDAGGEAGPLHSSSLVIVANELWPLVDLRVDWTDDDPIAELRRLWERYEPQMDDYVARALNPNEAPRYGVPGDS